MMTMTSLDFILFLVASISDFSSAIFDVSDKDLARTIASTDVGLAEFSNRFEC